MENTRLLEDGVEPNRYNSIIDIEQAKRKPPRVVAIDLLRGLIMVFESIDHAKFMLTTFYSDHETWYSLPHYNSWFPFIIRLITHLCAPGFAFLAGVGVVLFSASRKQLGWTDGRLVHHFFIRGFLLVVLNMLQTWNWTGNASWFKNTYFATTVLFSLGTNFFLGAMASLFSNRLYDWSLSWFSKPGTEFDIIVSRRKADTMRIGVLLGFAISLAVLVVALTPSLPTPEGRTDYNWLWYLIFLPGWSKYFVALYPPLDWLSLTIYGVAFGYIMLRLNYTNRQNAKLNLYFAATFLPAFFIIRTIGKFGNVGRSLLPPPTDSTLFSNPYLDSPMAFFNVIKYPPDLAFISLFMGLNHLILALFYLVPPDARSWDWLTRGPLVDYGRSALFFYIIHFYLYSSFAWGIAKIWPRKVVEGRLSLEWAEAGVVWALGLVMMWILCRQYGRFKASKGSDSVWRFF